MATSERRTAITAPAIPRPREPEPYLPPVTGTVPEPPAAQYPWPEPWRTARGAVPRTEYWDIASSEWHSRGPLPRPRRGE
jgi:hypothetical protein